MAKLFPSLVLASLAICGCRSADTGRVDARLAAFIPADTVMLAGARMDEIRSTSLYQKLRAQKRLSELDDLAKRTGFDPRKDVSELLLASNGKDTVTIARGRFHPTDPDATKVVYKGYTLYVHGEGAYALIDDATALAGTQPAIRAAIDQYKIGGRSASGTSLLARARSIQEPNQVWAVANGGENLLPASPHTGNAANALKVFNAVDHVTLAADLRNGLSAVATGECKTEQDAKALGDALRGLAALGRMSVPENQPDMLRLYDSLKVDQQQRAIKVVAAIAPDLIDKFLEMTNAAPRVNRGPMRRQPR
jgi:hypothetical protein